MTISPRQPSVIGPWALWLGLIACLPLSSLAADTLTVNDQRTFDILPQTSFSLDGSAISASEAAQIGAGFSVQVRINNVNPNATGGQAVAVDLRNLVRGPVTATQPLSVLNQPLSVTAETQLIDIPGNDLGSVAIGDLLDVSGFLDVNGVIVATRVRLRNNPTAGWKLFGQVSALSGQLFAIGAQAVDFSGVTPMACVPEFGNGQLVEMETLANAGFGPGSVLTQLTSLTCADPNFTNPPPGTVAAALEGIISALPEPLPSPASFSMLGVEVLSSAQTEYRAGSVDDLDLGVRVEVEGFYDAAAQTLSATTVRFVQAQVRFEAPVAPTDITPGESIVIMGNSVSFTAQTRDEDGIMAGLLATEQVELRGLIDRDGRLFATRVRERGQPDLSDTRLRGPVAEINEPDLLILGIVVDTSVAQYFDHLDQPISRADFYALLHPGVLVSAENAIYDPVTATLVAGSVALVDQTLPTPAAKGVGALGLSRGTLSRFGSRDAVFDNGFE